MLFPTWIQPVFNKYKSSWTKHIGSKLVATCTSGHLSRFCTISRPREDQEPIPDPMMDPNHIEMDLIWSDSYGCFLSPSIDLPEEEEKQPPLDYEYQEKPEGWEDDLRMRYAYFYENYYEEDGENGNGERFYLIYDSF